MIPIVGKYPMKSSIVRASPCRHASVHQWSLRSGLRTYSRLSHGAPRLRNYSNFHRSGQLHRLRGSLHLTTPVFYGHEQEANISQRFDLIS